MGIYFVFLIIERKYQVHSIACIWKCILWSGRDICFLMQVFFGQLLKHPIKKSVVNMEVVPFGTLWIVFVMSSIIR